MSNPFLNAVANYNKKAGSVPPAATSSAPVSSPTPAPAAPTASPQPSLPAPAVNPPESAQVLETQTAPEVQGQKVPEAESTKKRGRPAGSKNSSAKQSEPAASEVTSAGAVAAVDLSSVTTEELRDALKARGYGVTLFSTVKVHEG